METINQYNNNEQWFNCFVFSFTENAVKTYLSSGSLPTRQVQMFDVAIPLVYTILHKIIIKV